MPLCLNKSDLKIIILTDYPIFNPHFIALVYTKIEHAQPLPIICLISEIKMFKEVNMSNEEEKYFNIQTAAQLSGLSAHTIRAWEKRYQALTPERSESGRRLYSPEEVERLTLLSRLTNLGSSIGQIARLSDGELKEIHEKLINRGSEFGISRSETKKAPLNVEHTRTKLLEALKTYQVDVISQLIGEAKVELKPRQFAFDILSPILKEVSLMQVDGRIQEAQFKALYALLKFHAGTLIYSHYEKSVKSPNRIVLGSLEHDHNVMDLMLCALLCCHHNMNFYYLSSSLPAISMIEALKATESNILIISLSSDRAKENDIPGMLAELSDGVKAKSEIWLVGEFDEQKVHLSKFKNIKKVSSLESLDSLIGKLK